jgi:hypothetical protein
MTKKLLFVMTILLVAALTLLAAAIDGKWVYEQAGRQGGTPRQTTITLKADGVKLTGTVTGGMGGRGGGGGAAPGGGGPPPETAISDGKVDGNNISFKVVRETPNGKMTTDYTGTISGDELKLKITRTGQDGTPVTTEVTAKRSTT